MIGVRVGFAEGLDAPSDLREEVARFELEVVAVDLGHLTEGPRGPGCTGRIVLRGGGPLGLPLHTIKSVPGLLL